MESIARSTSPKIGFGSNQIKLFHFFIYHLFVLGLVILYFASNVLAEEASGETPSTEQHSSIHSTSSEVIKGYSIKKVNHELIDLQGNSTEIIADFGEKARYQKKLEDNSQQVAGMRFHIHWSVPSTLKEDLLVKLDIQGYDTSSGQSTTQNFSKIYQKVEGFSGWAILDINESAFRRMGKMMAWKVTLLHANQPMAVRKSFTWDDK